MISDAALGNISWQYEHEECFYGDDDCISRSITLRGPAANVW